MATKRSTYTPVTTLETNQSSLESRLDNKVQTGIAKSSSDRHQAELNKFEEVRSSFLSSHMNFFDTRVYRHLSLYSPTSGTSMESDTWAASTIYPHFDYQPYTSDYYGSPTALQKLIDDDPSPEDKKQLELRKKAIEKFQQDNIENYLAARSFIHPYAVVKLAGAHGNMTTVEKHLTFDRYNTRRFYEIDGEATFSGNYSKSPTTTTLIRWGQDSPRGKTPYSFQDFVFCKWWNRIENNRLITLRRYASPVTDNIEFSDYDVTESASDSTSYTAIEGMDDSSVAGVMSSEAIAARKAAAEKAATQDAARKTFYGRNSKKPFSPLATAVTYFGEGTGNSLSEILSFTVGYNWDDAEHADNHPIDISSTQNDSGQGLVNNSATSSGLGVIATVMGFLGEATNGRTVNLQAAPANIPPDPYENGPYENRIMGPLNVITHTYKRKRGLVFKNEGLQIKFEYVSRPIAGINNKAILLDLMSNMLLLTFSSGSWFGGMWRYKSDSPAVYPWKYGDAMNRLHQGKLFGKDGAIQSLTKQVFGDGTQALSTFLPDAINFLKNAFSAAMSAVTSLFTGNKEKKESNREAANSKFKEMVNSGTGKAIQKVIAAKMIRGTTIPYIQGQRALLTGDPVGDWHLTIGNPLNPIAMIGNLIVKDAKFKFSDELGPDDFPIGFECTVTLDHGLGRDRDALESMFNRGFGRIYTLPDDFRSSADYETKVDEYTGGVAARKDSGRTDYQETANTYYGGGTRFIAKIQSSPLKNSGIVYKGDTLQMKSLNPKYANLNMHSAPKYYVTPWQMGYTM